MKETVLILGSNGMIGKALSKQLESKFNVFTTYYSKKSSEDELFLDVMDTKTIQLVFEVSKPDIVINLVAVYNNLDFCKTNKELVFQINGKSLKEISKKSNEYNSYLLHMSTDYVFDGKKGNYSENDTTNPVNIYGESKLVAEENIKKYSKKYCIIRTSMAYGKTIQEKTLPEWIIRDIKNGKKIELISDQLMTPTYLENLCIAIQEVINIKYEGILHIAGKNRISRFEFARKLLPLLNLDSKNIISVSRRKFDFSKDMPIDSSLNTEKMEKILPTKPEEIDESLRKFCKMFKDYNMK